MVAVVVVVVAPAHRTRKARRTSAVAIVSRSNSMRRPLTVEAMEAQFEVERGSEALGIRRCDH